MKIEFNKKEINWIKGIIKQLKSHGNEDYMTKREKDIIKRISSKIKEGEKE